MLNWVPLRKIDGTIFQNIDDENVLNELDFSEFEELFRVKQFRDPLANFGKGAVKKTEMVQVIESNRARNLIITARRIGMDYEFLKA